MLPYHTGVLDGAPTGPGMILMPGARVVRGAAPREIRWARLPMSTPTPPRSCSGRTYPKLAGWVRRLVDDDETAHEIASEAFVRLLSRWTRVDSPQSYLYMIATNLVRDHWRKAERERRAIRSVTAARGAGRRGQPGPGRGRAGPSPVAAAAAARPVPAALLRRLPDPGGRGAAAPARGHDQGRPVRGAGQAEDARWGNAMPDRRDDLDSWLDGRIEPLPPPPGTFELIKRRARRRKYRRLAVTAGAAAVIVAAAVTVPQVVNLPVLNPATATGVGATGARRRRPPRARAASTSSSSAAPVYPGRPPAPVPANFQPTSVTFIGTRHRLGDRPGRNARALRHAVLHLGRADRRRREDLDRGARAAHRPGRRGHRGEPDQVPQRGRRLGVRARAVRDARRRPAPGPRWTRTGCGSPTWRRWATARSRCSPPAPGRGAAFAAQCTSYTLYSPRPRPTTGPRWAPRRPG